jgi:Ice-binding-like/PEP-CTERM motif
MRNAFLKCAARVTFMVPFGRCKHTRLVKRVGTFLICAAASALLQIATAPNASAGSILGNELLSFAVLGASTVTNIGNTTLTGNLGVYPGTAITGFVGTSPSETPGTFTGAAHQGDAFAGLANTQLATAMGYLAALSSVATTIPDGDLTGLSLGPGVYSVADRAGEVGGNLHGTLTLVGSGGAADGGWVFLMPARLITAPGAIVDVSSLGSGAAVYWRVGSSATLDTTTTFAGNILAAASVGMNNGVTLGCGRALARDAAVTLINDTIGGDCSGALSSSLELSGGSTGGGVTVNGGVVTVSLGRSGSVGAQIPEPGTFMLLGAGIACLVARRPRSARGRQAGSGIQGLTRNA